MLRYIKGSRLIDRIPNAFLHEKFNLEIVNDRLMNLAKKQVNTIQQVNHEHTRVLQTIISARPQGQTLWQDII